MLAVFVVATSAEPARAAPPEPYPAAAAATASADPAAAATVEQVEAHGEAPSPVRGPRDPTVAASVLPRAELSAPGLRVAEALRGQAGVQVSESGGEGAPATASVRGATAAQLPVYLAGIRLNDDVSGAADLSRVPLWLIDRAEIYRGHAPFDADQLGVAGALFFDPRWPRRVEAGAGAMLGSFGSRAAWAHAAAGNRDAAVLVGASVEAAANDYPFTDDHGTLLAPTGTSTARLSNADVTTYDAWLLGRAHAGAAIIEALANETSREQGVPTLALVPSRAARASFDRQLGGVHATVPIGASGQAALEARTSVVVARSDYRDPLNELALSARRLTLSGERVDQRVALSVAPAPSLDLHAAVDASGETLARDADGAPDLRARRWTARGSLAARQWIGDAFSVQALGAVECDASTTAGSASCSGATPAGRVGVAWTDARWDAFVHVGRYVRVPTLGEEYGVSILVRGNPALRPESGVTVDTGARWNARRAGPLEHPWAAAFAFVRETNDLIAYVRSSEGFAEPFNVARARVSGVEGQLGTGVGPWLSADVTATLLDPRDTTPGRRTVNDVLPFQSRFAASPRIAAEWRPEGSRVAALIGRARAEIRWLYQSSRYADAAGLAVLPSQSSLDAEVRIDSANGVFTVRIRGADLLDAPRFDVVGFPLPGRSFFFSLEANQ
jgi:iron complex outermembrane receptor protein